MSETDTESKTAYVVVKEPTRKGGAWTLEVLCCPYCGYKHNHGAGDIVEPDENTFGSRVSHCTGIEAGMYDLVRATPEQIELADMYERSIAPRRKKKWKWNQSIKIPFLASHLVEVWNFINKAHIEIAEALYYLDGTVRRAEAMPAEAFREGQLDKGKELLSRMQALHAETGAIRDELRSLHGTKR
jgi:hypothetical protein